MEKLIEIDLGWMHTAMASFSASCKVNHPAFLHCSSEIQIAMRVRGSSTFCSLKPGFEVIRFASCIPRERGSILGVFEPKRFKCKAGATVRHFLQILKRCWVRAFETLGFSDEDLKCNAIHEDCFEVTSSVLHPGDLV